MYFPYLLGLNLLSFFNLLCTTTITMLTNSIVISATLSVAAAGYPVDVKADAEVCHCPEMLQYCTDASVATNNMGYPDCECGVCPQYETLCGHFEKVDYETCWTDPIVVKGCKTECPIKPEPEVELDHHKPAYGSDPTSEPTAEPESEPDHHSEPEPTSEPSAEPTSEPSGEPTSGPPVQYTETKSDKTDSYESSASLVSISLAAFVSAAVAFVL